MVFNLTNGNVVAQIMSTNPEVADFTITAATLDTPHYPYVVYYDYNAEINRDIIHIQFVDVENSDLVRKAVTWYPQGLPADGTIFSGSPFTRVGLDILPSTNEAVYPATNPQTPTLQTSGFVRGFNGVATDSGACIILLISS